MRKEFKVLLFALAAMLFSVQTVTVYAQGKAESVEREKTQEVKMPGNLPPDLARTLAAKQEQARKPELYKGQGLPASLLAKPVGQQAKASKAINIGNLGLAYVSYSPNDVVPVGMATFDLSDPGKLTHIQDELLTDEGLWGMDIDENGEGYGASIFGSVYKIYANGTYEVLDGINFSDYSITNVAYDYAAKTWYFSSISSLYTFDPEVKTLSLVGYFDFENYEYMYSMAADAAGTLYGFAVGVNSEGFMFTIDQASAAVTKLGTINDGIFAYKQELAYDRNSDKLYLASMHNTREAYLFEVNTTTGAGTNLGLLQDSVSISGFAIPFAFTAEGAPAGVADFTCSADALGALSAELSFTTPGLTYGGESLSSIDSLLILVEGETYLKLTDVAVSTSYTETLSLEKGGLTRFEVVCYNAEGEGEKVMLSIWIGKDYPTGPENLSLSAVKNGALLNWTKPADGINGGYFDGTIEKYQVTRSDGKVFDIVGDVTSYLDQTVGMGRYKYTLTSYSDMGAGSATTSNLAAIYSDDYILYEPFSGSMKDLGWTSGNYWQSYASSYAGADLPEAMFMWAYDEGTDRLISPVLNTTGVSTAVLSFQHVLTNYFGDFTLMVQTTSDGGETWNTVWSQEIADSADREASTLTLSLANADVGSSDFQLAFVVDGPFYNLSYWAIDNVTLYEERQADVRPVSIAMWDKVLAHKAWTYGAKVNNQGSSSASFEVTMEARSGEELVFSSTKNMTLDAGAGEEVLFDAWTPEELDYDIKVYTRLSGDELVSNDTMFTQVKGIEIARPVYSFNTGGEAYSPLGLTIFDKQDSTRFILTNIGSSLGHIVSDLKSNEDGNLLITSYKGIGIVDTSNYTLTLDTEVRGMYSMCWSGLYEQYYGTNGYALVRMDPETHDTTQIGSWGYTSYLYSIEGDENGQLWGIDYAYNYLARIDPLTGKASAYLGVSDLRMTYNDNLNYDTETSTMYYVAGATQNVYTVDMQTGAFTFVRTLNGTGGSYSNYTIPNKPLEYASLSGHISNSADDTPVADATITLSRSIGDLAVTLEASSDAEGNYTFQNVLRDTFAVAVSAKYFELTLDTLDLSLVGNNYEQDYQVVQAEGSARFIIYDSNSEALEGAVVSIYGLKDTTNVDGETTFLHLPKGDYPYLIKANGHDNYLDTLSIEGTQVVVKLQLVEDNRVERNYLVAEDFTGTWCTYCPGAQMGIEDLRDEGYPIAAMAVHYGDDFQNTAAYNRAVYYEISSFPTINFDGGFDDYYYLGGSPVNSMAETYKPIIDPRVNEKTPLALNITEGSYDPETRKYTGKASMKAVMEVTENKVAFIAALTESHIDATWSYGVLTTVEDVLRDYYPDYDGQSFTVNSGDTRSFDFEFTLDEDWVANNSHVIVFVQDLGTNEIYNADMASVTTSIGTNISTNALDNKLKLYPNPVQNNLHMECEANAKEINIYNFMGARVAHITHPKKQEEISLEHLPNGVYVVELVGADQSAYISKIIKQ